VQSSQTDEAGERRDRDREGTRTNTHAMYSVGNEKGERRIIAYQKQYVGTKNKRELKGGESIRQPRASHGPSLQERAAENQRSKCFRL